MFRPVMQWSPSRLRTVFVITHSKLAQDPLPKDDSNYDERGHEEAHVYHTL